ncbi:AAA family ATPase [Mucilaginibacter sp.]|uniref:AAA family ATPase n=1 Tax=Mucilaginibacter sp. TaxID=1882438 RepID=UPI0025D18FF9|nr:AAA family ATPase [Mucilaginibacter sp.]
MQKEKLMKEARQLINDFAGQKGMSKNKLAKKLEVSGAVLSFIENGQHDQLSDEILKGIISHLKAGTDFKILGTVNFNSVQNTCRETQSKSLLNAVIGFTGAGKTEALKDYYNRERNVYYVQCKNSMNRKQFLYEVLSEMGHNFMGSVYEMVKLICKQLNQHSEPPLLIIDEAGKLSTNVLLDLHDIRNATLYSAGILMAGCEYFKKNVEKAVEKDKTGYPEFYSRVVNWNELTKPSKAEIAAICKANGVTDDDTIKDFCKLSNYRLLYNAIVNERDAA